MDMAPTHRKHKLGEGRDACAKWTTEEFTEAAIPGIIRADCSAKMPCPRNMLGDFRNGIGGHMFTLTSRSQHA